MLKEKSIAVVIPAYNEEKQIGMVLEGIPDYVDRIIVVNDNSSDNTKAEVARYIAVLGKRKLPAQSVNPQEKNLYNKADLIIEEINKAEIKHFAPSEVYNEDEGNDRLILINNLKNTGVGGAVARGYKWCKDFNIDCVGKLDGDGQMDPSELEKICLPVVNGEVDYTKGNRLIHRSARIIIPKTRFLGNSILSILTKIASGYWQVSDTQTAFSAISNKALHSINLYDIYKSYGYPNDLLVKLNIAFCSIKEVEIKPIYEVGEQSKMKIAKVIPRLSFLLLKLFFQRLWQKYLLKNFHPLFILYHMSFLLMLLLIPYGIKILGITLRGGQVSPITFLFFLFLFVASFQSLLFAMWMDMQDNERLQK
jgi:glycosyltransferase involved in cell wall biosynthesis